MANAKASPQDAGDTWTWTALDSESKLIASCSVGGRDSEYAMAFMDDLRGRLDRPPQRSALFASAQAAGEAPLVQAP